MTTVRTLLLGVLVLGTTACEPAADSRLPTATELKGSFGESIDLRLNGNVVEIQVTQSPDQLRRGGPIWAKAGPVGGVRVTTLDGRERLIARALLQRSTLTSVTWTRAINISGRARVDGTTRPNTMVKLYEYGQENTEFEYSARYVGTN